MTLSYPVCSRCPRTPVTSASSTIGSRASSSYVKEKFTWCMFKLIIQRQINLKRCQMLSDTLRDICISTIWSTAITSYIHQKLTWLSLYTSNQRQIYLKWSYSVLACSPTHLNWFVFKKFTNIHYVNSWWT